MSRPRLNLNRLEDRCTPTVSHTFVGGNLTITSDGAADAIRVLRASSASDYYYVANGVASVTFPGVSSINVNGNAGADVIDVSGTATPIPFVNATMSTSASSVINARYAPFYAFSGAGLSGETHTATTQGDGFGGFTMWLSANQANVDGQFLQIGLGDTYNLSKLQLWNYNQQYTPSATVRGIKTGDVLVSTDGATYTTAKANITFTQAPGTDAYNTPDTVYLPGAPAAKFVRILAHSNFASDGFGNYVGVSEVKFFGEATTATLTGPQAVPTGATATTTVSGTSAAAAGNGSGLNGFSPPYHDTNYTTAWLSTNQANVAGQAITFDLGTTKVLNTMRVWNYNQNYFGSYSGRGMKVADVQFSLDGITYATIASPTIPQAPAAGNYLGTPFALPNAPTRFVRFVAQSNWNNNVADAYGNFVGLSEVSFFTGVAAPPAPLPVTVDGGPDADTLIAGAGNDTLAGGLGADVFAFNGGFAVNGPNTATIADFLDGVDKLDFRPLGVNAFNTGGGSLTAQGGSAMQMGLDVSISVPSAFGTRKVKLANFLLANLGDADFVP